MIDSKGAWSRAALYAHCLNVLRRTLIHNESSEFTRSVAGQAWCGNRLPRQDCAALDQLGQVALIWRLFGVPEAARALRWGRCLRVDQHDAAVRRLE